MMTESNNQPQEYDRVSGDNNPSSLGGVVLGGIEAIKKRLASNEIDIKITAIKDALNYPEEGLDLVIQALQDDSRQVQLSAYQLLRNRTENKVQQALANYQPWNLRERFQEYPGYKGMHATVFANRQVENFEINTGIVDPINIAYAFRYNEWEDKQPTLEIQLNRLLEDSQLDKVEALIFGMHSDVFDREQSEYIIQFLVNNKDKLKNLKAVFIGDIHSEEWEISWIHQSNMSPVLDAYPNLELLQIRAGEGGVAFTPTQHDNLQSLIIESSGLPKNNVQDICNLNLPALEHLELWLGTSDYDGDSSIEDLKPILFDNLFPHLIYLGLRNSEYTNEIATTIVNAPILSTISFLDLSMGTLTDEGAEILLTSSAIRQLKILNISDNYLSDTVVNKFEPVNTEVIADRLKIDDDDYRYCSVTE